MRLGRVFTVYALTLAICLLVLGSESGPEAAPTGKKYYDGELTIAAPATQPAGPAGPAAVTMATPKGQVTAAQPMELGRFDIPVTALLAYQRAADILAEVKPSCALRWTLLAAIGRVESDHGRYGASTLGADGVSRPEVVGVPLDGQGQVATIADTDGGQWDGDPRWDHAVGPMQFIPATWEVVGVDGDGDGKRSINDIDDAALAAGIYLCAGSENLNVPGAVDAALHRYNDSDSYAALVLAYERKYEGGDFVVTAPGGALAAASATLSLHPLAGTPLKANSPAEARTQAKIKADAKHAVAAADKNGGRTPGISSATVPGKVVAAAVTTPSETRGAQAAAVAASAGPPGTPGAVTPTASGTASPTAGAAVPAATGAGTATSSPTSTTPSSPNATPDTTSTAPSSSSSDPSPTSSDTPTSSSGSTSSGSTTSGSTTSSTPDPTPTQPTPSDPPPSDPATTGATTGADTSGSGTSTPSPSPSETSTALPPCDPNDPPQDPTATPTCVPPATTDPTTATP